MKFATVIAALLAAHVQAGVAPSAAVECGDLGIMDYDEAALPAGVVISEIRTCAEHPLALSPNVAHLDTPAGPDGTGDSPLERRACWYGRDYGCTDGYCWKKCIGDGRWCWTAWNKGWGNWQTCSADNQCKPTNEAGCGESNNGKECKKCGCSC
ncbi:hypothetical protein CMUS01_07305 [Colletotrichum musicola]|uniref:IDI-2 n=1 Tax=Colletotrichum musicola TaxID=2175873 RepID=A0A8H6KHF7_9PEZI|nr:hypothetical protein CMUS01_07305 [Colletotrichum musicola]